MDKGTEKPLTATQMKLFEDNLRLVPYVAHRYGHNVMPLKDDRLQAARIGLWRAVRSYDPTREIRLVTYAVRVMVRTIRRTAKQERAKVPTMLFKDLRWQLRKQRSRSNLIDRLMADSTGDPESHAMSAAYFAVAARLRLRAREDAAWTPLDVLYMMSQGVRQSDIARKLNISRERIRQIVNSIRAEWSWEGVTE